MSPTSLLGRTTTAVRTAGTVLLVAAIAAVGSERIFWFWAPDLADHVIVTLVYALPAGVLLWAVARHRVDSWWSLVLALPLYSLVTEGAITPVVYSGGPFVPVFPAWFAFWHGVLAAGLLVFGIRALLLARRYAVLGGVAAAIGLFWGLWSATLWLPENVEDPELIEAEGGPLHVLGPGEFALYAATFTLVLIIGHWLLGFVWPERFAPSRWTVRVVGGLTFVMVAGWTVVVPWALPMFAVYAWIQRWGLRRHEAVATGPDLFARLHGRVPAVGLLFLVPTAVTAAATYAAAWWLEPAESVLQAAMWSTIAVQTVAGFVLVGVALRRAGRRGPAGDQAVAVPSGAAAVGAATSPTSIISSAGRGTAK